jgi:antitoxin CptB
MPDNTPELRRLRWQCRRGLLELDFLFNQFLDTRYQQLTLAQQADFVRLLSHSDQDLLYWFTDQASVPVDLQAIFQQVRAAKAS